MQRTDTRHTLTRDQLYDEVWRTPMRHLARAYGLSDAGLAKVCKRHQIPTPPVGYWAKLQYGKMCLVRHSLALWIRLSHRSSSNRSSVRNTVPEARSLRSPCRPSSHHRIRSYR